jgi:hypothetical protein
MSLFVKVNKPRPTHLKSAITGFQGSGKTHTAVALAIGFVTYMKKVKAPGCDKPVFMYDSERGHEWISPMFEKAGIDLFVCQSRAYVDLKNSMQEAMKDASLFLIDSITHPWIEFTESYAKAKKRSRGLEFHDWNFLKREWRQNFTEHFLNSKLHIIMCGRAGYEYDHYTDESGKKQIEKSGVKLRAEGELGFEPNLLVVMDREQAFDENKVYHVAHVYKDRRPDERSLDGKSFRNPTFKTFLPHVEFLNLTGNSTGIDTSRTSEREIPRDNGTRDKYGLMRDVVVEEIKNLLNKHHGQTAKDKEAKLALVQRFFAPTWTEVEHPQGMGLDDLKSGYDRLHRELEGAPSRYAKEMMDDELPDEGGAPSGLEILVRAYEAAQAIDDLNSTRDQNKEFIATLSEGDNQKEAEAYGGAVKRILKAGGGAIMQVAAE